MSPNVSPKALRLIDLSKRFSSLRGKVEAVSSVNLVVAPGEFFVFLGPSGCGKSTLLNLVAGLERPSGGEIRFGDMLWAGRKKGVYLPPRRRDVSMVFQSYALYPHMNVFDNIGFPLKVAGVDKKERERAVRRTAGLLGISDLLDARPGELSGGQRQRVAIGRAIVRKPSLFLLDEPLSNLDARLRAATRVELKQLQRNLGITTLYVTHDQTEAMTLGDRVALLRSGRLEQVGPPGDLYHRPRTPFAATFLGSPPMNLMKLKVVAGENGARIRLGKAEFDVPAGALEAAARNNADHVRLGIRPEHIAIREPGEALLTGRVETVEFLGRETLLHVSVAGRPVMVLCDRSEIEPGAEVGLEPDWSEAHFFPAAGEEPE